MRALRTRPRTCHFSIQRAVCAEGWMISGADGADTHGGYVELSSITSPLGRHSCSRWLNDFCKRTSSQGLTNYRLFFSDFLHNEARGFKARTCSPENHEKISYKNVSDSVLAQFQACENKEFWNMTAPKQAASKEIWAPSFRFTHSFSRKWSSQNLMIFSTTELSPTPCSSIRRTCPCPSLALQWLSICNYVVEPRVKKLKKLFFCKAKQFTVHMHCC